MRHVARAPIPVGVALVGFLVITAGIDADGTPPQPLSHFGICSGNVADIQIVHDGRQGLPVMVIRLSPEGRRELHEHTRSHVGRELDVVFDGVSFGRNKIHASVDSGLVVSGEWRSIDAARAFARLIRDEAIDAPCGVLEPLEPDEPGFEQPEP